MLYCVARPTLDSSLTWPDPSSRRGVKYKRPARKRSGTVRKVLLVQTLPKVSMR